jgi:hypothetical protein
MARIGRVRRSVLGLTLSALVAGAACDGEGPGPGLDAAVEVGAVPAPGSEAPAATPEAPAPFVPAGLVDDVAFASPVPSVRPVIEAGYAPFARAGGVTLHLPAARVELIGLHESSHDGARPIVVLDGVVRAPVLAGRERDTASTGAADIVVDPAAEIRSPVTGRVIAANTYALYCRYRDDLVFIEPDEQPGWQVKVFHIDRHQVRPGQRVQAGITVLAPRATQLPFVSQVDELTTAPSWPHVHVEVVDPSIRDRPSAGGGC